MTINIEINNGYTYLNHSSSSSNDDGSNNFFHGIDWCTPSSPSDFEDDFFYDDDDNDEVKHFITFFINTSNFIFVSSYFSHLSL